MKTSFMHMQNKDVTAQLISVCNGCTAPFVSDLVGNSEDNFSCLVAKSD